MATRILATLDGTEHPIEIEELAADSLALKLGGRDFNVDIRRIGPASFSILVDHRSYDFDVTCEADEVVVASRGVAHRVTLLDGSRRVRTGTGGRVQASGKVQLKAMMPGRVVGVLVKVGDEVASQQGVVVVEAMKMENELKAPKAGKVTEIKVVPGQTVEKGDLLIEIE